MAISTDMPGTVRLREVFSASFGAFGRHAAVFVILSAIATTPALLGDFVLSHRRLFPPDTWRVLWVSWAAGIATSVFVMIAYGAIVHVVLQDLARQPAPIRRAVAVATRRLLPPLGVLLTAQALNFMYQQWGFRAFDQNGAWIVFVGMILLTVALYFGAAPVCIAEKTGIGTALARCRLLSKGHRWQIFVAILLVGVLEVMTIVVWNVAALRLARSRELIDASMWSVLGSFDAVLATVFYCRLRSIERGMHIANVFD